MSLVSDTHGDFTRFYKLHEAVPEGETWGVVILGDASVNFWLSKRDKILKHRIHDKYPNLRFYLVRGNHEARPESLSNIEKVFDEDIKGYVYIEPEWPNIKYLIDGYTYYNLGGRVAVCLGGAYSVDKEYRLERQAQGLYGGWFEDEQLSEKERDFIASGLRGRHFDLVLSHTCPLNWEPRDLFLSVIDQSKVDDSMEKWMEQIKDKFYWRVWLFGHFHDDRIICPGVQMLSTSIQNLEDIMERWKDDI